MRPDIYKSLCFCKAFGFIPFQVSPDGVSFAVVSRQFLYFMSILVYGSLNVAFITYGFLTSWQKHGIVNALQWSPWQAGFSLPLVTMIVVLLKRQDLANYLCRLAVVWRSHKMDHRYHVTKEMRHRHIFYALCACVFPIVSIAVLNWTYPHMVVFPSSVFCHANTSCPIYVKIVSIFLHGMWLFYGYLAYLIMDLLPMGIAMWLSKSFEVNTDHIREHNTGACTFNCKMPSVIKVVPVTPQTNGNHHHGHDHQHHQHESDLKHENLALNKIQAIRRIMAENLHIQRCLKMFNSTFSPFIILSTAYIFSMCVVLFFTVIKLESKSFILLAVFFGNGSLILIRGSMVLNSFGNVRQKAMDIKDVLHLDVGLLDELRQYDPSIVSEVNLFTNRLENTFISAGPYFNCTHSFLMSFYGVLATYVAILIQSV